MNSEAKKNDNFIQLKNFLSETELIEHGKIINNINAVVEYHKNGRTKRGEALVSFTMEGEHCGNIDIESDDFPSGIYHTGFSTAFQNYEFDEDSKSLIIRGNSSSMHGDYEVRIIYNG